MTTAGQSDAFTRVSLHSVTALGKCPAPFSDPIAVKVVLEVFGCPPKHSIDVKFTWKPIWDFLVDQVLDEFEVGPLATVGKHELVLHSDPPDVAKIPDPTGPTALTIAFTYRGKQFLHIGYNAVVLCEGEMPDVFEDAAMLSRQLTQCFKKETTIAWDEDHEDVEEKTVINGKDNDISDVKEKDHNGHAAYDDEAKVPEGVSPTKKKARCEGSLSQEGEKEKHHR